MAYETFTDKWSVSANDTLDESTHFNDPGNGIQDELELRLGDSVLDGVVSGMVCTADDANDEIDIAPGRAYVAGKRYSGNTSVDFTGKASDTYYVYIDSADDTTPYKAKTTAPTSGELTLCTVDWDGSSTFSNLDDSCKVQGVLPCDIVVQKEGTLSTGVLPPIPVLHDMWIESVQIMCADNGSSSGSVTVDVHLGTSGDGGSGTTIFTTQGNRPSLAHDAANYTIATSGVPDGDRKPDAGEYLSVQIEAVDGGGTAADLTVWVKGRVR